VSLHDFHVYPIHYDLVPEEVWAGRYSGKLMIKQTSASSTPLSGSCQSPSLLVYILRLLCRAGGLPRGKRPGVTSTSTPHSALFSSIAICIRCIAAIVYQLIIAKWPSEGRVASLCCSDHMLVLSLY